MAGGYRSVPFGATGVPDLSLDNNPVLKYNLLGKKFHSYSRRDSSEDSFVISTKTYDTSLFRDTFAKC